MVALLSPGKALLNRLSYPGKFLVVSLLLILPLVLAIALLMSETLPRITFTESELAGVRYLQTLRNLLEHVIEDQMLARDAFAGTADQEQLRFASHARINTDLAALSQLDTSADRLPGTASSLDAFRQEWRALQDTPPGTAAASEAQYDHLIGTIRQLITEVGDRSNLILDPELTSYYLMDTVLLKLPEQAELLARATREAEHIRQGATVDTRDLVVTVGLLQQNSASVQQGLGVAFTTTPGTKPGIELALAQHQQTSASFVQLLEQTTVRSAMPISSQTLREQFATARTTNAQLWERSALELERLLQTRRQGLYQKNGLATGAAFVLLLVVLYLLVSFYRSVMDLVGALDHAARRMVDGDIDTQVAIETRDELGTVVRSFNMVATALVTAASERHIAEAERAGMQEQVIRTQRALLDELAAPLIPITDDIVVLPLIGNVDAERMAQLIDSLGRGVVARRASVVIVDITGVLSLSADVASGFARAAQTAQLLGARFMLTGIRSNVAYTLAMHDTELHGITTYSTLSSGVAEALAQGARRIASA